MMVPNMSSSNAIWRRNKGTYGDKCFARAEAPLFTLDITHMREQRLRTLPQLYRGHVCNRSEVMSDRK